MKKLLFVVNNLNIGGPQKSLLALLDNINYDLFDISLISLEPNGLLLKYINNKVNIIEIDELFTAYTLPSKSTIHYIMLLIKCGKYFSALDFVWILLKYIFKKDMNPERQRFWKRHSCELPKITEQFDASFGVSSGISTYFVVDCIESNKKYHWVRGDYSRTSIDVEVDEYYFKQVDGSLSVSKECSDIFQNIFPFMNGTIRVFYNVLPIKFYERIATDADDIVNDSSVKLLTVARLDQDKGLDMAVDACMELKKRCIDFRWYILGDGNCRKKMEKIIKGKHLEEHMYLLGFRLNTFEYIKHCDIFVHPSRSEGKSNAVDEALFLKKLIVVTNYATVCEQITNNVNGFICNMSGVAIADMVEYLIENVENLKEELIYSSNYDYSKDPTEFFLNLI